MQIKQKNIPLFANSTLQTTYWQIHKTNIINLSNTMCSFSIYIQVPDGAANVNFLPQAIKRQNGLRLSTIW